MALCNPCYDLIRDDKVHSFLSDICASTFRDWLRSKGHSTTETLPQFPGSIHLSWESFCDSLDRRCPICWVSWHHIRDSPTASYRDQVHQRFDLWLDHGHNESGSCGRVILKFKCSLKIRDSDDIVVRCCRTTKQQFKDRVAETPIEEHTGSETTLNTVKGWLSKCDGRHACVAERRARINATVPTRLIDVHYHDSQAWSLVETKNHQEFSKYIAVSHRWKEDTPRLLRDNFISFQTGQHDKTVPPNYRDVFLLCRRLDIRYVWIDSLCIFQDSEDDFLNEAATMTEVYANAFCTFSICWECSRGFLRPRDSRSIPRKGPLTEDPLNWSDRYVFVQDLRELHMAITQAPVNQRGWVLQEQLLSPRILYVGNDQFYWECDQRVMCETEPNHFRFPGGDYRRENIVVNQPCSLRAWHNLVEHFMRLNLKFERDRLLAISGIARLQFRLRKKSLLDGSYPDPNRKDEQKFGQDFDYFAGLRRAHWIADLLWYPDPSGIMNVQVMLDYCQAPEHESFNRCPDDIVPSWSWAACPGPIQWVWISSVSSIGEFPKYDGEGPLACLRRSHFEPLGSDFYGLPKSASLDISCLLIKAEYTEPDSPEYVRKVDQAGQALNAHFDWQTDSFLLSLPHPGRHCDEASFITLPVEPCEDFITNCFVMPLLQVRNQNQTRIAGLIVQERSQAESNAKEFVRIGSFTKDYSFKYKDKDRSGMGVMSALLKNLPTDGDKFEQQLRECAQRWKEDNSLGTELEDNVTLKAEWATIRLV